MALVVDVLVTGAERTERDLERLARRLERPPLRGLVDKIIDAQRLRFQGQGSRWRRLAPSTVASHRHRGRGAQPLVLTGQLRDSLTRRGHPRQVVRVTPTTLYFGTRVWYAHFHHLGQGVPRRTVVGLTRQQRAAVVADLQSLLVEGR